jgi:flagellar assembly protein FliH
MRNFSKFIPGEEVVDAARWSFSDVEADKLLKQAEQQAQLNEELAQAVREEAYAEGFQQGQAATRLEAQQHVDDFVASQGQENARLLAELLESAKAQLEAAEHVSAHGVLELACEIARHVVRQEVNTNPNVLMPAIREALETLFADTRAVTLRLHPQDLDMLEESLNTEHPNLNLTFVADPALLRGGCQVEAGGTFIDGRLERRWSNALAQLGFDSTWTAEVPSAELPNREAPYTEAEHDD